MIPGLDVYLPRTRVPSRFPLNNIRKAWMY